MKSAIEKIQENSFADACYTDNTIGELENALTEKPDIYDMREWNLTEQEWRDQIQLALDALIEKAV